MIMQLYNIRIYLPFFSPSTFQLSVESPKTDSLPGTVFFPIAAVSDLASAPPHFVVVVPPVVAAGSNTVDMKDGVISGW